MYRQISLQTNLLSLQQPFMPRAVEHSDAEVMGLTAAPMPFASQGALTAAPMPFASQGALTAAPMPFASQGALTAAPMPFASQGALTKGSTVHHSCSPRAKTSLCSVLLSVVSSGLQRFAFRSAWYVPDDSSVLFHTALPYFTQPFSISHSPSLFHTVLHTDLPYFTQSFTQTFPISHSPSHRPSLFHTVLHTDLPYFTQSFPISHSPSLFHTVLPYFTQSFPISQVLPYFTQSFPIFQQPNELCFSGRAIPEYKRRESYLALSPLPSLCVPHTTSPRPPLRPAKRRRTATQSVQQHDKEEDVKTKPCPCHAPLGQGRVKAV